MQKGARMLMSCLLLRSVCLLMKINVKYKNPCVNFRSGIRCYFVNWLLVNVPLMVMGCFPLIYKYCPAQEEVPPTLTASERGIFVFKHLVIVFLFIRMCI